MTKTRFIGSTGYVLDSVTKEGNGQEQEIQIKIKFRLSDEKNPKLASYHISEALRRILDRKDIAKLMKKNTTKQMADLAYED